MLDKNISNKIFEEIKESINNAPNPLIDSLNLLSLLRRIHAEVLIPTVFPNINHGLNDKRDEVIKNQSEIAVYYEKLKEYENLLSKEQFLISELKTKQLLSEKVKELEAITLELRNSDLDSLRRKIDELNTSDEQGIREYLELISSINGKFANVLSEFKSFPPIVQIRSNHKAIESKAVESLTNLTDDLAFLIQVVQDKTIDLESLKGEYNTYLKKLKGIQEEIENLEKYHSKNVESWNLHFQSNTEIWGNLNEPTDVDGYIKSQTANFSSFLKEFDSKISSILKNKENLKFHEYVAEKSI